MTRYLEGLVGGIDCNRDWSNCGNGICQLILISTWNVNVASVCGSDSAGVEIAFFILPLTRHKVEMKCS